jgi:HK97 family phage major capsid protein
MNRILQQQQEKTALIESAQAIVAQATAEKRSLTGDELTTVTTKTQLAETIVNSMKAEAVLAAAGNIPNDRSSARENILDKPFGPEARDGETKTQRTHRLATGFGEQLRAVRNAALNPEQTDPRLRELNQRGVAAGSSEAVPADGGFLVAPDFSQEIMAISHDTGMVYTRGRKLPISEGTNAIKIPGIDEQSRADGSRWGGVRMFWQNEADALAASKPKFRLIELVTKKLTGLYYATDEVLRDAAMLGATVTQAFGEEVGFKMDDSAINGDGSGKPLGILNSTALITVAKESGQLSGTLVTQNIVKMFYRLHARSRKNAVFFVNQDVEQQLLTLTLAVGTGGSSVVEGMGAAGGRLYTPPGQAGNEYGILYGRPVIPIEQCQTLGTVGDIILADMSQWVYVDKGDAQQATSMHVRFLTDEMTFRWIYRVDGTPIWHTPLTPFKGTNTQSPFITLATR